MRIRQWGTWIFGCVMGLLPLIAWLFAHGLTGGRGIVGPNATRELLFFAVSTSSIGVLKLAEDSHPGRRQLWILGGLVITIFSALFYGEFLTGEALHAAMRVRSAYNVSLIVAGAALLYGGIIEGITHQESSQ